MDASRDGYNLILELCTVGREWIEFTFKVGQAMGDVEFVGVGIAAGCLELLDLLFAAGLVLGWVEVLLVGCLLLLGLVGILCSLYNLYM